MRKIIFLIIIISFGVFLTSQTVAQEENSTDSADTQDSAIRQKVQQKVEEALNKPKAKLGTITDISEQTIQITNLEDEIVQIEVNKEETQYVKINDDNEQIEFSDVAIGDFIVAMGYINENDVLEATRVLVTDVIRKPLRAIVQGKVVDIQKKEVTIRTKNEEYVLIFPKRWKGPEIEDLSEGVGVIAIGELNQNELSLRTIEIIDSESSNQ